MEKQDLNNSFIPPQKCDDSEVAQWQWQSGPDPFKETDPAKWIWQNYLDDETLIIEEAYFLNQETVFLKDYEIDLKKMVQATLKDKNKIRRVRRLEPSRFMMKIPEAKAIVKSQKTLNEAFGTVQHFLEYIMKRTAEAYALYQRLEKLSLDDDRPEFEDLTHQVQACIEKGAEVRAKIIKTRAGVRVRNFISEARKIMEMIEDHSATLRDFLKSILKVYTMETFVCYWLNELLRSEDWEEINVLTPYLVCLVYTFKLSDYVLKPQNSQLAIENQLGFVVKHRRYLYRGAALTKEQLASYNPTKITYFSWNAVTSTSRDINVAQKFVHLSLNETTNVGVIFIIEIDFDSITDYHGMVDVSKDSRYPNEQEVILAPGTVFQLREVSLIENDIYEIRLRVRKVYKETHEEVSMLGALQNRAISRDKAILYGLPSQEGLRLLELIRGNKLIRKLEIRDSGIGRDVMQQIENLRETTNVRKEDIELIGNNIFVSSFGTLAYYFSASNISNILARNKVRFQDEIAKSHQITPKSQIKHLILKDEAVKMFRKNGQLEELWERIKNEIQTQEISLLIPNTKIEEDEFKSFLQHIKHWKSLENLTLAFNETQASSIENLEYLCQVVSSSTTLKQLSLKFPFSDKGLNLLQKTLQPLQFLQNLSLDCSHNNGISDEGLKYLKDALASGKFLQHLSLRFVECSFSDEGLNSLIVEIKSLALLQHLHLGLRKCDHISDAALKSLEGALAPLKTLHHLSCDLIDCNQISMTCLDYLIIASTFLTSLKHFRVDVQPSLQPPCENPNHLKMALISLTPLQPLSAKLKLCTEISDEGLNHLGSVLISLPTLQHLFLDLSGCNQISDKGLDFLTSALSSLKSLQYFSLYLARCRQISDEVLNYLKSEFTSLTSIQHLNLDLSFCENISDKGLDHLKSALLSLTSLKHLSLIFPNGRQVSDEGLNYIGSAFTLLTSLQHLSLNFEAYTQISDKELKILRSALPLLTSLQHLSFNFSKCSKVSDEGLNYLGSALTSLTSLQHLSLDFEGCNKISDEGLNHLKSALIPLTSLQHLSLDFMLCYKISNEGLNHLNNALLSLTSLQHLNLDFSAHNEISDQGLNHLKSGLKPLTSLQHLHLYFSGCNQISDQGLNHLKSALISLTSLQHLSLDFMLCYKISNEGLNHLNNALLSLTSLQRLSLDFEGCNQISNEGLIHFKNSIILLTSLQRLYFNFLNRSISENIIKQLESELESISSLTIYMNSDEMFEDRDDENQGFSAS